MLVTFNFVCTTWKLPDLKYTSMLTTNQDYILTIIRGNKGHGFACHQHYITIHT